MTGAEMKAIRERAGLSQSRLAALLGSSLRGVQYWEADARSIPGTCAMVMEMLAAGELPSRYTQ